jgi:hypothetical protein
MIQHMLIFCLAARCKAIVFYSCDTRVVYANRTWGTDLSLDFFFVFDNLDRWTPCEPADPLSKDFYSMAVKKFRIPGKQEDLGRIGLRE